MIILTGLNMRCFVQKEHVTALLLTFKRHVIPLGNMVGYFNRLAPHGVQRISAHF